jgi:nicotinamidase/pyrazinamidase
VDIQNGFMPLDPAIPGTGELPVAGAPDIVPLVNKLSGSPFFTYVVDTQDWHPANHGSFASQHEGKKPYEVIDLHGLPQALWTDHCRQDTPGAEFYPALDRDYGDYVAQKGTDPKVDSYSGFWDNGKRQKTGLADWLRSKGVTEVFVVGVTRPFCVTYTAKDAVDEGFSTYVVEDACSMLALDADTAAADTAALLAHGVHIVMSGFVLNMVSI